jgi:hypothetical protein
VEFDQAVYEVLNDTLLYLKGYHLKYKESNDTEAEVAARHCDALRLAMCHFGRFDVVHPNLAWARARVLQAKGINGVTRDELDSIWWDPLCGCYKLEWRGMMLGLEVDGHIHS